MKTYTWVNLFELGTTVGLLYFKAYVDDRHKRVVGWVTRTGEEEPYSYNVYYVDARCRVQATTRGTWQHADWAVQGAVADQGKQTVGSTD